MSDIFYHPSEAADIVRRRALNNDRLSPTTDPEFHQHPAVIQPGSKRESDLLEEIDIARDEELAREQDTFETRRLRSRHHWRRNLL